MISVRLIRTGEGILVPLMYAGILMMGLVCHSSEVLQNPVVAGQARTGEAEQSSSRQQVGDEG